MRRSTFVIVLLFFVMAGAYYYVNHRSKSVDTSVTLTPTQEVSYLFKTADGQPSGIRIESKAGTVFEMDRNADKAWALKKPDEAAADQGSAEAAASQVTAIRISEHLPSTIQPAAVGLDTPEYKLIIQFAGGVERKADIGVVTPSESGYYARIEGETDIVIVSKDSIDALIGLLTNPPYAQTPTPSPVPPTATETPLPSPTLVPVTPTEATATPKP